mmetsp:Transcript_8579/g.18242  ORF Transcript_8579/g.18242 Transcript_8579/m.18242 type:complete len:202 (+) Transcript_8579:171-776(+)
MELSWKKWKKTVVSVAPHHAPLRCVLGAFKLPNSRLLGTTSRPEEEAPGKPPELPGSRYEVMGRSGLRLVPARSGCALPGALLPPPRLRRRSACLALIDTLLRRAAAASMTLAFSVTRGCAAALDLKSGSALCSGTALPGAIQSGAVLTGNRSSWVAGTMSTSSSIPKAGKPGAPKPDGPGTACAPKPAPGPPTAAPLPVS